MHGVTIAQYQKAIARRRLTRQEEPEGMEPTEMAGPSRKILISVIVIVVVIIVGVAAVVFSAHPTPTGVTINFNSGKVTSVNSSDLNLAIVLSIHNSSNKNITYWYASYDLSDDGTDLGGGLWSNNVVLTPGATRVLNEVVDINLGDVIVTTPITSAGTWLLTGNAYELVAGANVTQGFSFNFATQ